MNRIYITGDTIGAPSGGGVVTKNEYEALAGLTAAGAITPVDALQVQVSADPFATDLRYLERVKAHHAQMPYQLAHVYAGCFTETVKWLKAQGCKVTYTAAAHDPDASMAAFAALGVPYPWAHMAIPVLREKYVGGYRAADLVICPSTYSAEIMRGKFGCKRVTIIPHGIASMPVVAPLPAVFAVGYLGSGGPDKGLRYLLAAWAALDYLATAGAQLLIGGNNAADIVPLWRQYGGRVTLLGWVPDTTAFYNRLSVYVQPSVTEGFGIEIIEALAHGRPVIASEGAGASAHVRAGDGVIVPACDSSAIAVALRTVHDNALSFTPAIQPALLWANIKTAYQKAWANL